MEDLKRKVSEIENQYKRDTSKEFREILFLESLLLQNGVNKEFSIELLQLFESDGDIGNHQFKYSDYRLGWEKSEKGTFHFYLLNKVLGRKLGLRNCPPNFYGDISRVLPQFIEMLHKSIVQEN